MIYSNWKIAKQCSRIVQPFCNLTDDFQVVSDEYSAFVQSFVGTEVFNSSLLYFSPLSESKFILVFVPVRCKCSASFTIRHYKLTFFFFNWNSIGTEYTVYIFPVFSFSSFFFWTAFLGPPEFNLSSCVHCINITIKLPPTHLRKNGKLLSLFDIYNKVDYEITLRTVGEEHKVKNFSLSFFL